MDKQIIFLCNSTDAFKDMINLMKRTSAVMSAASTMVNAGASIDENSPNADRDLTVANIRFLKTLQAIYPNGTDRMMKRDIETLSKFSIESSYSGTPEELENRLKRFYGEEENSETN